MVIDRACAYRGQLKGNLKEATEQLRADIMNPPKHAFGEHSDCDTYFCNGQTKPDENMVPTLTALKILPDVQQVVLRVAQEASSLIHNMNNNDVEAFHSTLMQSTGKKVINFTGRFGYRGRSYRGVWFISITWTPSGTFINI